MKNIIGNAKLMLITPFYPPSVGGVQFILHNICKRLSPDNIMVMRSRDPLDDKINKSFKATQQYKILENRFYKPTPCPIHGLDADDKLKFAQKSIWNRLFLKSRVIRLCYLLLSVLSTLSAIRRNQTDVLWCGYLNTRFMAICLLSKYILRIPFLLHTYGEELPGLLNNSSMFNSIVNRIRITGLKHSSGIFTLSSFSKECLLKAGVPEERIILKNPCVDIDNFKEDPAEIKRLRKKYDLDHKKIILSVGNITERKGVDIILKLIPALMTEVPDLVYMIIGKFIGDEESKLKTIISECNIKDNVIFVGEVPHDQIAPYFYMSDVFCLATRKDQEGFGMVFIEANACKKPIVGFNTGGVRDAVIHGETGLLVELGNVAGFKNALLEILTNNEYAEELGENGYNRVLKEFPWDRYAEEVYKQFNINNIENNK